MEISLEAIFIIIPHYYTERYFNISIYLFQINKEYFQATRVFIIEYSFVIVYKLIFCTRICRVLNFEQVG